MRSYCVYILTNKSGTLYIGVTGNLTQRLLQHRNGVPGSFTARYKINRLVYVEESRYVWDALEREKELKGWTRAKKLALIREANPKWRDLSVDIIGDAHELQ
jgi:putative endonuclease